MTSLRLQHWIGPGETAPSDAIPVAQAGDGPGFQTDPDLSTLDDADARLAQALASASGALAAVYGPGAVSIDATADGSGAYVRVQPMAAIAPLPPGGLQQPADQAAPPTVPQDVTATTAAGDGGGVAAPIAPAAPIAEPAAPAGLDLGTGPDAPAGGIPAADVNAPDPTPPPASTPPTSPVDAQGAQARPAPPDET